VFDAARGRIATYVTDGRSTQWTAREVGSTVRVLILALTLTLAALANNGPQAFAWSGLLVAAAIFATVPKWSPRAVRVVTVVESIACVVAVLESGSEMSPLFPYLLAPAFAGALVVGLPGAVLGPGFAGLGLVVAGKLYQYGDTYAPTSAQWVMLAVVSGLVAAWIGRLLAPGEASAEPPEASYAAAYRLLAQLRPVARQLSVGLDPVTIAEGLLQSLRSTYEFERGAVLVRTGGSRLVPLAHAGGTRDDWNVDVTGDGPFAEAWLTQREQRLTRQLSGEPGSAVVVPLVIGVRTFGLVGLETERRDINVSDAASMSHIVAEAALRLETAMLFDEVRGVATAEERRRLAREIHDGIAQELSYLGYVVDGLTAEAREVHEGLTEELRDLRREITRIISELRLSIFDLRSEVDVHGGLGAALSEYVRSVGQQSDMTVHLSLDEAPTRLPAETEAELLRIAQEAITNARKHAEASNLWVTLVVDPPSALLRVEDDGRGLGVGRHDSFGLQIMRERASRLRTHVEVAPRQPRGTRVEVVLGGPTAAATRLPDVSSDPMSSDVSSQPRPGLEELPST
jgi:signal transduction histidine kinase